jgi:hypothetical protein
MKNNHRKSNRSDWNERFNPILILFLMIGLFFSCNEKTFEEPPVETGNKTPLDVYVQTPDPAYQSQIMFQAKKSGYTYYVLKMISQTWLTREEVDKPEWWHWIKSSGT